MSRSTNNKVKNAIYFILLLSGIYFANASGAAALDTEAQDYVPPPSGKTIVILYYVMNNFDEVDLGTYEPKRGTEYQDQIGMLRLIRSFSLDGMPGLVSALQQFGGVTDSQMDGEDLQTSRGPRLGDLMLSAFLWPISKPEKDQYLGFGVYFHVPDGSWNPNISTNIGDNRFSYTVQGGYIQPILPKLNFEFVADGTFYQNNNDATTSGGVLSQEPTYEGQLWANYHVSPVTTVSAGLSDTFGGYSSVNGVWTGNKTQYDQVKLSYQHFFVKPQIEVLIEGDRYFDVVDGLDENIGVVARIVKVF